MREETFMQALERCLQEADRGRDLEAIVEQYPQYADELRSLLEVASAVERHYAAVPEPPGGLAAGRARFLAAARQHRLKEGTQTASRRTAWQPRLLRRLAGVALAIAIGIAAAGGGVAWAASESLPGTPLYPVKLSIEEARLTLASSPYARVSLALRFAEERVEEIQALAEAGLPVPEEVVTRMELHLGQALMEAMAAPEGERLGLLERVAERTQRQAQVLEQVRAGAPEHAQPALSHALAVCRRGHEAAVAALEVGGAGRERGVEATPYPTEMPTFVSPVRTPPGQERTPPGQERTPPGQEWTPPGQERTPPGQELTPPGQERTPPGQEQTPPGQEQTPPGQEQTPPGQERTPPGQEQPPPGQDNQGGGGKGKGKGGGL